MQWAFMTANYVGRALGYANNTDWMANHRATVEAFHGPQFGARFAEMIDDITAAGFDAIELWVAHLEPLLATPDMIATANQILRERGVKLISYTAGFGQPGVSREDATRIFETAKAIGAPVFAQGFHPANGPLVAELGQRYSIRMGLENHPHKTAQEVIDIVAPFAPWVGSANDTGWFATQGYDAVRATYELRDYLVHMHLKDITAVGGHETCALGDGVVDIPGVLTALKEIGYTGAVSVEHEPYDHDPTAECALSLKHAAAWWAEIEKGGGMIDPTPALAYLDATQSLLERIRATQLESIGAAAAICAESIAAGGLVHLFGTGHSRIPVEEIFPRHGSFPGFHPIVELSLTYHTQVVGANGQRQAMFLERIEGFGEVILRNFVFGPHDSCMVFSNGGVNEVVIDVALGAKRRGMPVIAVVSRAHCAASPARHSSGRRLPDIADVTVDNCAPLGDALVTVAGLEYPVGPASTVGYAIVVNMLKCLVAAELTRRGQPPLVLTSGALIGSQASAELFDRTYDDYRARVAQVYGRASSDE